MTKKDSHPKIRERLDIDSSPQGMMKSATSKTPKALQIKTLFMSGIAHFC
jgi:hypothetical protein